MSAKKNDRSSGKDAKKESPPTDGTSSGSKKGDPNKPAQGKTSPPTKSKGK